MIAYLDSSVVARAYLVDEDGHQQATALLADPDIATVTGTWTRIEVSGALVRAARAGRGDEKGLLALLDADLAGPVIVLGAPQDEVEQHSLELVRRHALRAMDAWHLAVAALVVPPLLEPGEPQAFASRDEAQRKVAEELGFVAI
ncbi:type II toxin-antitoxin system VapC family toxin [Mycobacterium sp. 663a-19]|uniref:type II toxin-antitoxin system VapC family toxin n=1 Tax=Mycobacterium sp. 663a-19 TaxID=2986148 RepID=UPI002D1EE4B2|nr:type II toxin-antitoxin system VapC family toxin [Mycobacterium sp. 663a-19]MEB3980142.1 type II toxin-antitoxin system VapC family toxin [Mycobacterium sp. 663a-19]